VDTRPADDNRGHLGDPEATVVDQVGGVGDHLGSLFPDPCGLFTANELAELIGRDLDAVNSVDTYPSECTLDHGFFSYRFEVVSQSAWDATKAAAGAGFSAPAEPLPDGPLGDDSYHTATTGESHIYVLVGGVRLIVYDALTDDGSGGLAVAAALLDRADLRALQEAAAAMPDVVACDLLTVDEFGEITGLPVDASSPPRVDGMRCVFGSLAQPGRFEAELSPMSPDDFPAYKAFVDDFGMTSVVDASVIGDDSIAYTVFGEYRLEILVGATLLGLTVTDMDDDAAGRGLHRLSGPRSSRGVVRGDRGRCLK
jgi:hypothetical protein